MKPVRFMLFVHDIHRESEVVIRFSDYDVEDKTGVPIVREMIGTRRFVFGDDGFCASCVARTIVNYVHERLAEKKVCEGEDALFGRHELPKTL